MLAPDDQDATAEVLDLRGVRCPLNWAKARVRLDTLARDEILELIVDDERAVRDIPRAAEASGYDVVAVRRDGEGWRLRILR